MKSTVRRLGMLALVAVVLGVVGSGCETESADQPLTISVTPATVTLARGQSVTFRATGGYQYQWRLSRSSYGLLSSTTGDQVTYTAFASPDSGTAAVIVIVTSVLPGQGTGNTVTSTNVAATTSSGQAVVTHL